MFGKSKLRGPVGRIYPISILCIHIILVIEIVIRRQFIKDGADIPSGPVFSFILAAAFFALMGLYQLIRYKAWIYLVLGLLIANSTINGMASFDVGPFNAASYYISLVATILFIVVTWPFLYGHERFEANARRLFKLACDSLIETSAGFTSRPYAAGTIDYSSEKIQGFARFLKSKYVVKPLYREQGVYLLFSLGASVMNNVEPKQVSYVLFEKTGQVTVHISAYDYRQYTERFTFDQLCSSFGTIFIRFLGYYQEGHEERIVTELKSV
jgi:hypothetical protein